MLTSQLKEIILNSLDMELYSNLVFFAEKLHCENPKSEEVKYLLAKGYIGEGKYHKAFQILKHTHSHQCRYLFTLICIKLNKFIDAEKALLTDKFYSKAITNKEIENVIPNGAAGFYLLGVVHEKMSRKTDALLAYKKSVDLDPFMWCAYERMCKLDPHKVDINKIYTELNPKILVFNKKFLNNNNNNNNCINNNNFSTNKTKANNNKDFLFSPDDTNKNNNNNNNDSISSSNFCNKKAKTRGALNEQTNSSELNKYRTFLDFNSSNPGNNNNNNTNNNSSNTHNNSSSVNMTPVVHKEEVDYSNLNYKNYLPVKNNVNNPFVFSSSPNHVHLEFNSSSLANSNNHNNNTNNNNNQPQNISSFNNNINNFISNGNSSSGFNITNNNLSVNNQSIGNSSRINPFNINTTGNNASSLMMMNTSVGNVNNNNVSINANNVAGQAVIQLPTPNVQSGVPTTSFNQMSGNNNTAYNNNDLTTTPVNIFNNIHLTLSNNQGKQNITHGFNENSNSYRNKKARGCGNNNNAININFNQNNLLSNIQISPYMPQNEMHTPQNDNKCEQNNNNNNVVNNNNNNNNNQVKEFNINAPPQNVLSSSSSFQNICQLLKYYADILKKMSLYDMENAIKLLLSLPKTHLESSYAYSSLGRCYFELGKYKECEKYYNKSLQKNPSQLEGIEYFSSCLWHLKDQYQCCNLAHKVLEQSQFAPETWIVLGNCFSLQKEHEIAIRFFTRATQINPNFAYAYTLSGHEYVENENYNQAANCYKNALKYDDRHFNAWWGLGLIQSKEQNYSEAIKYFKKALSINTKSAILHFYLATAYLQNKDITKALQYLKLAEEEDNNNPMIKYQISNIYINKGRYDEALEILLGLDEKMPKEAPIHIAIGKIYKIKKEYEKALEHFNIAIDLDPKDSNLAKSLIERLHSESGNENIFPGNK